MPPSRPFRLALLVGLVLALALAGWGGVHFLPRLFYRHAGHLILKPQEGGLSPAQIAAIRTATRGLKARIAYSSSQSGNHELYLLTLPAGELRRLTSHPHVDYYPRFSPDGRRLVFARSQREWVSERDYLAWDAYLMDLASGEERLLARDANFPGWAGTGRVVFTRGEKVMALDLATGRETPLFDGGRPPIRGRVATPEICRDNSGLLAVSGEGDYHGGVVVDLRDGGVRKTGDGCELIFLPPGCERVAWMDTQGKLHGRVVAAPWRRPGQPATLFDAPGEFSHEYFPRASADGKWLVFGASTGDHEHDIADYEIFLWEIGTPMEGAVRLTHNPGNDRWPDIHLD